MTWRAYEIQVRGYDPFVLSAPSRGAAMAQAFRNFSEPYPDVKFGEFLKQARVISVPTPTDDGYDYVRRNYGVDVTVGQRVTLQGEGPSFNGRGALVIYPGRSTSMIHVVIDGMDHDCIVHPLNVLTTIQPQGGEGRE